MSPERRHRPLRLLAAIAFLTQATQAWAPPVTQLPVELARLLGMPLPVRPDALVDGPATGTVVLLLAVLMVAGAFIRRRPPQD